MQHIPKQFVRLRREKPESGVRHPFERHRLAAARHCGIAFAVTHTLPYDAISRCRERRCVGCGGGFKAGLRIMENVDVAGKARAYPVDGNTTRDIAVGAALRRKHPQYLRLKLTEWHGKALRS